jgi:hypothetical protein
MQKKFGEFRKNKNLKWGIISDFEEKSKDSRFLVLLRWVFFQFTFMLFEYRFKMIVMASEEHRFQLCLKVFSNKFGNLQTK